MEKTKKMTKAQMFAQILSHTTDETERKFIEHEMELLAKKNAPKDGDKALTPAQKANEDTKRGIVDYLTTTGKRMTITDMIKEIPACAGMTNQKVSALVRQLLDALVIVRTEEKGKALFSVT
jgi:DNA-binding transcriptional regulator GbsR (MarR family)